MTENQLYLAAKLWRKGVVVRLIAEETQATFYTLKAIIKRDRDMFPHRREPHGMLRVSKPKQSRKPALGSGMKFTNTSGYVCTMPRVSILMRDMG